MACYQPNRRREGYATAAAVVIAVGLGLLATAVTASALGEMRLEQARLLREQNQRTLDSANVMALEAIWLQPGDQRLLWRRAVDGTQAEILAEPEAAKLDVSTSDFLKQLPLTALGVTDSAGFAARIADIRARPRSGLFDLAGADEAEVWRRCGLSLISPYGRSTTARLAAAAPPVGMAYNRRAGQVWRVRVVLESGVVEDRIVRFTGLTDGPVLLLERRRQTGAAGGDPCAGVELSS